MKHDKVVTYLLVAIFLLAQIVGILFVQSDITDIKQTETGVEIVHSDTAIGPRPAVQGYGSVLYLVVGVFVATILLLILMKFKFGAKLWRYWYFFAVVLAITVALGVYLSSFLAFLCAVALAIIKLKYRSTISHNLTEILMYAGLAVLLVPLFDVIWGFVLLGLISLYDMYAVWKSKHMVKLAKFTTESKLFAGLSIDYKPSKNKTKIVFSDNQVKVKGAKQAILGGGDIVFPLIFTGAVTEWLIKDGFSHPNATLLSLVVSVCATIALYLLFYYAKKDRFYPAMPFITVGCIVGFALVYILKML